MSAKTLPLSIAIAMGILFAQEPARLWMNPGLSRDREATGPKNSILGNLPGGGIKVER
jgi:hypothetical protein